MIECVAKLKDVEAKEIATEIYIHSLKEEYAIPLEYQKIFMKENEKKKKENVEKFKGMYKYVQVRSGTGRSKS